ncbi:hypothetical protein M9434_006914 [Picochlorum sp. BPE23]|nr:hypothetical protein M9434_006914 [Picochlorum sp. BPE23]
MGVSNFIVTVVGVGAIAMLMKTDVRTSASMLRRNLRHIRSWMEETAATSEQTATKQIKSGKKPPSSESPVNDDKL